MSFFTKLFKKTESAKEDKKDALEKKQEREPLPKGFANDAMRNSNVPDTLYGFDDPLARRLGPVPTSDPTNTGA
ncbi:hypothetical protein [Parasitella parasitica]|uniref:Uncharacterized protein n=1 Tax=Parasitella parasitica TaxID=35722 RepID=A0A0B7MZG5_9FUNG|nr:hypothetical protein [Parasitella parasitica]